jgi:putative membrane protein
MKLRQKVLAFTPVMMALAIAVSPSYAQDGEDRPTAQRGQDATTQQAPAQRGQTGAAQQGQTGAQQGQTAAQRGQTGAQQGQANAQQSQGNAQTAQRGQAAAGAALNDGQILQVVRTLNDGEIKQANEATDQSENDAVKQVAEMIIMDHEASNEQMDDLLNGELNLEDSPLSDMLAMQAEETHERLQDLDGAQYDCQYLQAQVAQHQMAIDTAKNQLAPNAKNADVKSFLTAMTPKLEHHMQMAQDSLGKAQGCDASNLTTRP